MPVFQITYGNKTKFLHRAASREVLDKRLAQTDGEVRAKFPLVFFAEFIGTRAQIFEWVMENMLEEHRNHWCASKRCSCSGSANKAGRLLDDKAHSIAGLTTLGYTKKQWQKWLTDHPKAQ